LTSDPAFLQTITVLFFTRLFRKLCKVFSSVQLAPHHVHLQQMEALVGAAVLPEVLGKTWDLLQEHGRWFAPRMLVRYEESYVSSDSSQSPLR